MKTMFLSKGILSMWMAAFTLMTLTSCDKESETPELPLDQSIVGTWDVSSYALDGDEWMGLIVDAAVITFQEPVANSGIFIQEVTFADEESTSLSGRYILDAENDQVTMYYEGEPVVAEIHITGNKMHWDSTQDGYPLVLKATKRP